MKLRKNDKIQFERLTSEQRTRIYLAEAEVRKVLAEKKTVLDDVVYHSMIWCCGLVLVIAIITTGLVVNNMNIRRYNLEIAKLDHKKVMHGFVKMPVKTSSTMSLSWTKVRKEDYNNKEEEQ